jgi:threonine 3-dehydrogenase
MITALTIDVKQDGWHTSKGFIKRQVEMPQLNELADPTDASSVIVEVHFAGICGSDRGIWHRAAFTDLFHTSLEKEGKSLRVLGHEFVGKIVDAGSFVSHLYGIEKGDMISGDSHVTCGKCFQCRMAEQEVCQDQKILGISTDGIFAQFVKIPAKNLWKVDTEKIRPEICAVFDPFGNAVHALSKVDVRGADVAIFGCGQIGLFSVALARQFGAANIIAVDVNAENLRIAKELGAHHSILIEKTEKEFPYLADTAVITSIQEITGGKGVDVSMEMAGFNSSVTNCLEATRFGGDVILFGIKDGDLVIPKFSSVIVKGLTLHSIIGRQIFQTWQVSSSVLGNKANGVQDSLWNTLMHGGTETVIPLSQFEAGLMEERMAKYPKLIFDMRA